MIEGEGDSPETAGNDDFAESSFRFRNADFRRAAAVLRPAIFGVFSADRLFFPVGNRRDAASR